MDEAITESAAWLRSIINRAVGFKLNDTQNAISHLSCGSTTPTSIINSIRRRRNISISDDILSQHPTLEDLAAWLVRSADRVYDPLVQFEASEDINQEGGEFLFCVHPVTGIGTVFKRLADALKSNFKIFGLQARGINVGETPLSSYDDLSTLYADRAIEVANGAPINVLGWSAGGHIALQMAEKIRQRGHPVGLLILVDTWISPEAIVDLPPPLPTFEEFLAEKHRLFFRDEPYDSSQAQCEANIRKLVGHLIRLRAMSQKASRLPMPLLSRIMKVAHGLDAGYRRSRPRLYDGPTLLIAAGDNDDWDQDVEASWRPYMKDLSVACHPSDHLEMLVDAKSVSITAQIVRDGFMAHARGRGFC